MKPGSFAGPCPCGGGALYRACCRRFHEGEEPADPSELVRTRFSAFALGRGAYLWRTLHPDHALRARPEAEVIRELSRAKNELRYLGLTIHDARIDGDHGVVLFAARVFAKGRDRSFVERSRFVRTGEGWRYLDGVLWPASELRGVELTIAALSSR
jgi:SEC-C motif-containing protein